MRLRYLSFLGSSKRGLLIAQYQIPPSFRESFFSVVAAIAQSSEKWSSTRMWVLPAGNHGRHTSLPHRAYGENFWVHLCRKNCVRNTMCAQFRFERTMRYKSHVVILRANKLEKWSKYIVKSGLYTSREFREKKLTAPLSALEFTPVKSRSLSWSWIKIGRRFWSERTDRNWLTRANIVKKKSKLWQLSELSQVVYPKIVFLNPVWTIC